MPLINKKDAQEAMKGLKGIRKELEKERARLSGSMKGMRKHAKAGTMPEWTEDAMELFRSPDYSYLKLMKLLRKHKVL